MDTLERIRYHMKLRNWSEYRLAKEAGLSQSTIANFFRRNTLPSVPTLEIICKAFGISLSQFFSDNNESPDSYLSKEQKLLLKSWEKLPKSKREALLNLIIEFSK